MTAISISEPRSVSVVIAAYNAAPFLERAVISALEQTNIRLDLIIVDDGSEDQTSTVMKQWESDDRVQLISLGQNKGPASARNAGFQQARHDWIAVLDADDAYLPGRLSHLVASGERSRADVVADNFFFFDLASGKRHPALKLEDSEQVVSLESYVEHARPFRPDADYGLLKPIFRKTFLKDRNLEYPASARHGEDFELMLSALLHGARLLLCKDAYYLYTNRSSGLSRTKVDYPAQIARAKEFMDLPQLKENARVRELLRLRAAALTSLQMERRVQALRASQANFRLVTSLLGEKEGWRWIARRVRKRFWNFHG